MSRGLPKGMQATDFCTITRPPHPWDVHAGKSLICRTNENKFVCDCGPVLELYDDVLDRLVKATIANPGSVVLHLEPTTQDGPDELLGPGEEPKIGHKTPSSVGTPPTAAFKRKHVETTGYCGESGWPGRTSWPLDQPQVIQEPAPSEGSVATGQPGVLQPEVLSKAQRNRQRRKKGASTARSWRGV